MKSGILLTTAFATMMLVGCGESVDRPPTFQVTGAVIYKDKPVEGATVSFWTDGAARAAQGITNAEGKFKLTTFDFNDGAVTGTHTVTVKKVEAGKNQSSVDEAMLNDPAAMADMATNMGNGDNGPKSLIPAKYGDRNQTDLTAEVTENEADNSFNFLLAD